MSSKRFIPWFFVLAVVVVAAAFAWLFATRHSLAGDASPLSARTDKAAPSPEVAIQDGKTIDFSTGKPVVKNSADEKAIIDAAVKEMDAAAKDVSFAPNSSPGQEKKPADPTTLPPKP
jgi:hypothetical protein